MAIFKKKKKEEEVFDPSTRKASPAGDGKLEPFEVLIMLGLLYVLVHFFF